MKACKFDVLREVLESVVVPSIMYDMEVTAWSEKEIGKGVMISSELMHSVWM